jgi:FkbM family methyltransferase
MAVPRRWSLPAMARLDQWQGVEPESMALALIGPCRGIAIDVGANYGLYSYALSKLYSHVVAFEPNAKAMTPLAAWNSPRVALQRCALSSGPGYSTLYVPVKFGVVMTGWASLDSNNCPEADSLEELQVELRTLDSFGFTDVGFIKIDAEGHEFDVLKGAERTIRACLPHLLVEIRKNCTEVRELLAEWGYRCCTLRQLSGTVGTPSNFIFLPTFR